MRHRGPPVQGPLPLSVYHHTRLPQRNTPNIAPLFQTICPRRKLKPSSTVAHSRPTPARPSCFCICNSPPARVHFLRRCRIRRRYRMRRRILFWWRHKTPRRCSPPKLASALGVCCVHTLSGGGDPGEQGAQGTSVFVGAGFMKGLVCGRHIRVTESLLSGSMDVVLSASHSLLSISLTG